MCVSTRGASMAWARCAGFEPVGNRHLRNAPCSCGSLLFPLLLTSHRPVSQPTNHRPAGRSGQPACHFSLLSDHQFPIAALLLPHYLLAVAAPLTRIVAQSAVRQFVSFNPLPFRTARTISRVRYATTLRNINFYQILFVCSLPLRLLSTLMPSFMELAFN